MQIIDDMGAGGRLGAALGTGLQQLAQNKLAQIQKQYDTQYERSRYAKGLAPLLGEPAANFLANLNPDERKVALQNLGSLQQLVEQRTTDGMGGLAQPIQAQTMPSAQQMPSEQIVGSYTPASLFPESARIAKAPIATQQQGKSREQLVADVFTSPYEKREQEKLGLKREEVAEQKREFEAKYGEGVRVQKQKEKEASFKIHKPELKNMEVAGNSAQEKISKYKQLKILNASGELIQGRQQKFLKDLGFEDYFTNPSTQLAGKIMNQLSQYTNQDFGISRPTNFLVNLEQKSQGSLLNTKDGLDAIADNQILGSQAAVIRQKIKNQLLKKYEKRDEPYPRNLIEKINEKAEPLIKKYRQKAIDNIGNAIKTSHASEFPLKNEIDINAIIEIDGMPGIQWYQEGPGDWKLYQPEDIFQSEEIEEL